MSDAIYVMLHNPVLGIVIIVAVIFFIVQYLLCRNAKKNKTKLIPIYLVLLLMVFAALSLINPALDGFFDFREFFATLFLFLAVIMGASAGLAWLTSRILNKS